MLLAPKAKLVGKGKLVPFVRESFDENDTKNFRSNTYFVTISSISVHMLVENSKEHTENKRLIELLAR